jgi:hypothetical protein
MFRMTTEKKSGRTLVTLDGRLADSDIEEIHRVLSTVTVPAVLCLSGLETCSVGAVAELKQWLSAGFVLQGATPFIRMLLINQTGQTLYTNTK